MDAIPKRYLTVEEGAHYLSFSASYVYKLIESGVLTFIPVNGKQTKRLDRYDLEEWMDSQKVKGKRENTPSNGHSAS